MAEEKSDHPELLNDTSKTAMYLNGLDELQVDINNLLFLYFNAVGVIQRDCLESNINETISNIQSDIVACLEKINFYLDNEVSELPLNPNSEQIVKQGKKFVEDGSYFLDKILGTEE